MADEFKTVVTSAPRALADTVVEWIERKYLENDSYQPGHFIGTKKELQEQFSVAPATLGEAIRVLRNRGVISVKPGPGGGIFLAEQSPITRLGHDLLQLSPGDATVEDCLSIVDALDVEVNRDAAIHRTDEDARELLQRLAELEEVWHHIDRAQPLNWKLHQRIAKITPNKILSMVYVNVIDFILTGLDASPAADGASTTSQARFEVHRRLVNAIAEGDVEAVEQATREHSTIVD